LVCATWVGADDPTVRVRTSYWGQGGKMALPIFGHFMQSLQQDKKDPFVAEPFEVPEGIDLSTLFNCKQKTQNSSNTGGDLKVDGLGD